MGGSGPLATVVQPFSPWECRLVSLHFHFVAYKIISPLVHTFNTDDMYACTCLPPLLEVCDLAKRRYLNAKWHNVIQQHGEDNSGCNLVGGKLL